jgi:hypothetical protein
MTFRYDKMPYATIATALHGAGLPEGRHHRGSGWSDWGDLEYEPPVPGYVLNSRRASWEDAVYRVYVDHAGAGRKKALAAYAAVLTFAGFTVSEAPLSEHHKKTVLWVEGLPSVGTE